MRLENDWLDKQGTDGMIDPTTTTNPFKGLSIANNSAVSASNYAYIDTTSMGINYWSTYPSYWYSCYPAKISMTLSEIEHVRRLCRKDKRLGAIMNRMAPHIEVTIDFPEGDKKE